MAPRHPALRLALGLLALSVVGMLLLAQPFATEVDARVRTHFLARHYAQCAFDALSATAGAGFLSISHAYTAGGRWILTLLGLAGAVLYLHVAAHAVSHLHEGRRRPDHRKFASERDWVMGPALAIVGAWAVVPLTTDSQPVGEILRRGLALGSGLTLDFDASNESTGGARLAVLAAWTLVWLVLLPRAALARALRGAALWFALLVLGAFLVASLRAAPAAPRGGVRADPLSPPWGANVAQAAGDLAQIAGAGSPSNASQFLDGRDALGLIAGAFLIVGAGPLSPTGGVHWIFFGVALSAIFCRPGAAETTNRYRLLAVRVVGAQFLLTLIAAFGLLVIESATASAYDRPATFADAWLDGAAAVNGGNVSAGLIARVTDPNLSGGIGRSTDQYAYGTAWVMLALWIGRVAPIWAVCRFAQTLRESAPAPDDVYSPEL